MASATAPAIAATVVAVAGTRAAAVASWHVASVILVAAVKSAPTFIRELVAAYALGAFFGQVMKTRQEGFASSPIPRR